jgi:hypothetical protein
LMFCTVVLSPTCIFVVRARINMGQEMTRLYGEGVSRRQQDIDLMALYTSGGGKSHRQ